MTTGPRVEPREMTMAAPAPVTDHGVPRLRELDALRGLAAVSVVLHHAFIIFPSVYRDTRSDGATLLNGAKYTPVQGLYAGTPAVVLFFVLSGMVLALPYVHRRGTGYPAFAIKRIMRIWLPYAVLAAAAMLLATLFGDLRVGGLSPWFEEKWQRPVTLEALAGHAPLVTTFRNNDYLPVIWSLVHEMRVSLIFPALLVIVVALGARYAIAACVAIACIAFAVGDVAEPASTAWAMTFVYLGAFVSGILLAAHRERVVRLLDRAGPRQHGALIVLAIALYTWPFWFDERWLPGRVKSVPHTPVVEIAVLTVAAALIVVLAQGHRLRGPLHGRIPTFFGRISYSLYLVHTVVILLLLHLLGRVVTPLLILPVAVLVAVLASDLVQRHVEVPAQRLGRRAANRLAPSTRA